jgi:hypothetical protein
VAHNAAAAAPPPAAAAAAAANPTASVHPTAADLKAAFARHHAKARPSRPSPSTQPPAKRTRVPPSTGPLGAAPTDAPEETQVANTTRASPSRGGRVTSSAQDLERTRRSRPPEPTE